MFSTFLDESNEAKINPLTIDDFKKMAFKTTVGSTGTGKKKRWFEKLMNKFGWYRSSEWYFIDTKNFSYWDYWKDKKPEVK